MIHNVVFVADSELRAALDAVMAVERPSHQENMGLLTVVVDA